jgi:formiminotetrahydrofolate cyclodeaminase
MVANFTVGRPRFAAVEESMHAAVTRARALRTRLLALTEEDERAFALVSAAYKLPKGSEEERSAREEAIQAALHVALGPPLEVMDIGCAVLELASETAASGNPTVVSDAGCAALFGQAAVRAAALNVLANVAALHDTAAAQRSRDTVVQLEERAEALREHTMAAVHARMKGA